MGVFVARSILERILFDRMQPGGRLPPETELAKALGVGKSSLREGLLILELVGAVSITPGKDGGARVNDAGAAEYADITTIFFQWKGVTLREVLETFATLLPVVARLASLRRDDAAHSDLRALMDEANALDAHDVRAYQSFVPRFQSTIARLSGNDALDLYVESLVEMWQGRVPTPISAGPRRERNIERQLRIGEAILGGDPQKAEQLMRDFVEEFVTFADEHHPEVLDELLVWRDP